MRLEAFATRVNGAGTLIFWRQPRLAACNYRFRHFTSAANDSSPRRLTNLDATKSTPEKVSEDS